MPPVGGVQTSIVGLLKALARVAPDNEYIVFVTRSEEELDLFPNIHQRVIGGLGVRLRLRLWAQLRLPSLLRAEQVQLVHFMKNLSIFGVPCPGIVTIHDLSRLRVPFGFSKLDILLWRTIQPYLLRSVSRIIAVSEHTKRDLILEYGLPAKKITVIYNGSDFLDGLPGEGRPALTRVRSVLPPRFILYVGGMGAHKNLYTLIRAFFRLKAQGSFPHKLVIVGNRDHPFPDPRVSQLLHQPCREEVLFTGVVPDEELPSVYQAADLFVFPSLYEGFGLAPLEAMACGTPVIVSRRAALPEVVGEAGLYLDDPLDVEELAGLMARVLDSPEQQAEMKKRGLERARLFSWQRTAEAILQLYREVVSNE